MQNPRGIGPVRAMTGSDADQNQDCARRASSQLGQVMDPKRTEVWADTAVVAAFAWWLWAVIGSSSRRRLRNVALLL